MRKNRPKSSTYYMYGMKQTRGQLQWIKTNRQRGEGASGREAGGYGLPGRRYKAAHILHQNRRPQEWMLIIYDLDILNGEY